MRTSIFSSSHKVIVVLALSLTLSGMNTLIASDRPRVSSAGAADAADIGGAATPVPLTHRAEASEPAATQKSAKAKPTGPATQSLLVPAVHNVGYDEITNGITTGIVNRNSPTLNISEGDTVNFYGAYRASGNLFLGLSRTDSYVQIEDPSLFRGPDVCGLGNNLFDHRFDNSSKLSTEITGPMRKGVSGIFALGPEDLGEGFYEPAAGQSCNTLTPPAGAPAGHVIQEVASAVDPAGVTHKLCQLVDTTGPSPSKSAYGSNLLLESTWNNPDITGAVIRIDWKDLQKYDANSQSVVFDWTKLDTEFNQAARRGKMIFLELVTGDGNPDWIYTDFASVITSGPVDAKLAVPVWLRDTGSDGTGPGWLRRNGSPNDPHYIALVENLIREVVSRLRNDSRFFQALGSLKVTGTNFMTGEMRLQKNCTDDGTCPECWCNTEIWKTPLGTDLPAFSGAINNHEATKGGGYTEAGLYAFVQRIENLIYKETQAQKSLIYMLIQAGFPRVKDENDYWRDSTQTGGPVDGTGAHSGVIQTVNLLQYGREGRFKTQSDVTGDASIGKLFIPQHAGLQRLPQDQSLTACRQQTTPALSSSGKYEAPMPTSGSTNGGGCPNEEAVDESYRGQLSGFQTNNVSEVNTPDHLDSTLWNGTANSKMIFWEGYEKVLWQAAIEKGTGASALPLSATNYFSLMGSDYQKNLNYWGNELHRRRTALATAGEPNLADPFPKVHSVTFDKPLNPGEIRKYYFINPARCSTAAGAKYGTIVVTGR